MKKRIFICVLCLFIIVTIGFVGCVKQSDKLSEMKEIKPSNISVNGKVTKVIKGSEGSYIDINFSTLQMVNTIYIKESSGVIEEFSLLDMSDGGKLVYKQDYINKERYCAFESITTSNIRLVVNKATGNFNFSSIKAYYNSHNNDNFRSTAYVIANSLQEESQLDLGHFNAITDIILFGEADFDKNGEIFVNKAVLENAYNLIKSAEQKLNKTYTIYLNFLFKDRGSYTGSWEDNMKTMAKDITNAMKNNEDKLIANLQSVGEGYDGFSFDWEYPMTGKDFNTYGEFLVALKAKTNKKIAVALASWGVKFKQEHLDAIDVVELMTYDIADNHGNHSDFYIQGKEAIDYAVSVGIDPKKIDLGIPFYARPTDMGEIWTGYNAEASKLGKYGNKAEGSFDGTDLPRYYNGYQMVYDKVAYSLQVGVGGVMVWHYSCDAKSDSGLSLFEAIQKSVQDRNCKNMTLVD